MFLMDYPGLVLHEEVPENYPFNGFEASDRNYKCSDKLLNEYLQNVELSTNKSEVKFLDELYPHPLTTPDLLDQSQYYYRPNELINYSNKQDLENYLREEQRREYIYMSQMEAREILKNSSTPQLNNCKGGRYYNAPSSRTSNGEPLPNFNNSQQHFLSQSISPSYMPVCPKKQDSFSLLGEQNNQQCRSMSMREIIDNNYRSAMRELDASRNPESQKVGDRFMRDSETNLKGLGKSLNIQSHQFSRQNEFHEINKNIQLKNDSSFVSKSQFHQSQSKRDLYFNDDIQEFNSEDEHFGKSVWFAQQTPKLYHTKQFSPEVTPFKKDPKTVNEFSDFYSETENKLINAQKYKNVITFKKDSGTGYSITGNRASIEENQNSKLDSELVRTSSYFSNNRTCTNQKFQRDSLYRDPFVEENGEKNSVRKCNHSSTFDVPTKLNTCHISPTRESESMHVECQPDSMGTLLSFKNDSKVNQNANSDDRHVLLTDNYPQYQKLYPIFVNPNQPIKYKEPGSSVYADKGNMYTRSHFPCSIQLSKLASRSEMLSPLLKQHSNQCDQNALKYQNTVKNQNKFESYLEHSQHICNRKQKVPVREDARPIGERKIAIERYNNNNITNIPTKMSEMGKEIKSVKLNPLTIDYQCSNEKLEGIYSNGSKVPGISNKSANTRDKYMRRMLSATNNIPLNIDTEECCIIDEVKKEPASTALNKENNTPHTPLSEKIISNQEHKINHNSSQIIATFPKDLQIKLLPNLSANIKIDSNSQTDENCTKILDKVVDIAKTQGNEAANKSTFVGNPSKYNTCKRNGTVDRTHSDLGSIYKVDGKTIKLQLVGNEKCKDIVTAVEECREKNRQSKKESPLDQPHSKLERNDDSCCSLKGLLPNTEISQMHENVDIESVISKPNLNEKKLNTSPIKNRQSFYKKSSAKVQNMGNRNQQILQGICAETNLSGHNVKKIKTYSHILPKINVASDCENRSSEYDIFQKRPDMLHSKNTNVFIGNVSSDSKKTAFAKPTISKAMANRSSQGRKLRKIPLKHNSRDFAKAFEKHTNKWSKQIKQQIVELRRMRLKYWLNLNLKKNVAADDFRGRIEEDAFQVLVKHVAAYV